MIVAIKSKRRWCRRWSALSKGHIPRSSVCPCLRAFPCVFRFGFVFLFGVCTTKYGISPWAREPLRVNEFLIRFRAVGLRCFHGRCFGHSEARVVPERGEPVRWRR